MVLAVLVMLEFFGGDVMRYAVIENSIVTNTIESVGKIQGIEMQPSELANIGDYWDGFNFSSPKNVPNFITMRQARLALLDAGLLDEVEAAITTPENRIWWDYSTTVERNHPLVDAVLIALGKSPEEIDQMFIEAAKL